MQEQLEKSQAKYKTRHDKHCVDHSFQFGDEVSLYVSKERLKGKGKKLKPIQYGPFKIIDKIGNNAFRLDLPPYMQMYAVVNVENLKLLILLNFQSAWNVTKTVSLCLSHLPDSGGIFTFSNGVHMEKILRSVRRAKQGKF